MADLVWSFLGAVAGTSLTSFLLPYFSERGKNLATKADIADITTLTERAKHLATKADISEITAQVEGVKAFVRRAGFEHEVRFSKLHERRSEVIAELYAKLARLQWGAEEVSAEFEWMTTKPRAERNDELLSDLAAFYRYFDEHRIFLPELDGLVERIARGLQTPAIHYGVFLSIADPNEKTKADREAKRAALHGVITNDFPPLRKALEVEFRRLLGDVPPPG